MMPVAIILLEGLGKEYHNCVMKIEIEVLTGNLFQVVSASFSL